MSDDSSEIESMEPEAITPEAAAPAGTPATPAAVAEMWEEYQLKVNGKDVTERINLNDKERIKKALQMERAANEAFQSSASSRKQQEEMQSSLAEFIEELRANPLSILQHEEMGVDVRKMVEAYLQNEIDRSQKSPEQLQLEEAQAKLAALEEEKQTLAQEREAARKQHLEHQAAVELENEISDVIERGDLPKSKYISQKLTDLAYIAYSNGIDLSIAEIAPLVKKQYLADMKDMLGISNDEVVENLLGKDRIRAMRNKQLQSLKSPSGTPKDALKTQDTGANGKAAPEAPRLRAKDFFKGLAG